MYGEMIARDCFHPTGCVLNYRDRLGSLKQLKEETPPRVLSAALGIPIGEEPSLTFSSDRDPAALAVQCSFGSEVIGRAAPGSERCGAGLRKPA